MAPVRFPPGDTVLAGRDFKEEEIFPEIDRLLAQGHCPDGRLELETQETRLTCLIHRSVPHLAGLLEQDTYSWIPLKDFPLRARQLEDPVCSLVRSDPIRVLLAAVHFRNRPVLQASTELVSLEHVLDVLAKESQDAAVALERHGTRTLLFLKEGQPTRLYFGDPKNAWKEGSIRDSFLLHAFEPALGPGKVEVFKQLNIQPDPDAGTGLVKLAKAAKPPPPISIIVHLGGRVVLQRPFMPPAMTIGRDHTCELILDNLSVSRRHARLSWDRGEFFIDDLGSANGTRLNAKSVKRAPVGPRDRIGLGKFEISLIKPMKTGRGDETILMTSRGEEDPLAYLVGDDVSVPLAQEITIGQSPGVDVQARGFRVGPVHARIRPEGGGTFRLICSGSRKAKVNGRKMQASYLKFGDRIEVGRSRFFLVPTIDSEPTAH
jgi:pSer/pThr/pTyr-binding forkhead associated (FHA) protein